ncbi:peroxide stress protein YaaA [Streptococcus respiraculi]|uniref:peroxide stress protein YaaA n=1 Tax=Streptococcus respiraculi TaxID=2021971 RepID=UPI000E767219|nr:peroxide stress protein YaaA [Streptococcus respiraculi]
MKIILPNAKELNTNLENHPFAPLSEKSRAVLEALGQMSAADLAAFYKLKEDKAELEADRWHRMIHQQAKSYPAWMLYDGLMYRYMKRRDLSEVEEAYLAQHVLIATGFYGLIAPFTLISPHRLDFQGQLKVEGQSLKQFWRAQYDEQLADEDLIISLASSEFEQVFSPAIQKRMVQIVFMEDKEGELKVHSTISKKGRGRLVSLMAEKNVQTLDEIRQLTFDDFAYRADLSEDAKLIFVRKHAAF